MLLFPEPEKNRLKDLVTQAGQDLDELMRVSAGVVLIGSRAAGCHEPTSDYDIVVLDAEGPTQTRIPGLDLMFQASSREGWLSSDLCIHMTGYGIWLSGAITWSAVDLQWERAAADKRRSIVDRVHHLLGVWDALGPRRNEFIEDIVHDARLLACLEAKKFIPPRQLLPECYDVTLLGELAGKI